MKRRHGFVSNSSSASFVVRWMYNGVEDVTLDNVLRELLGIDGAYNEETGKLDFKSGSDDRCYCEHMSDDTKHIMESTTKLPLRGSIYETRFWVSMHNWVTDFGSACNLMMTALVMKGAWHRGEDFEILRTEIVRDY